MSPRKAAAPSQSNARPRRAELVEHRNEVVMVGRLAADPIQKTLPSGDEIVEWRLIVQRPRGSTPSADTVNCTARGARVRLQALGWRQDEVVEVSGSLHRRFWRGAAGVQNRYEIEVVKAMRRADPAGLTRRRKPG